MWCRLSNGFALNAFPDWCCRECFFTRFQQLFKPAETEKADFVKWILVCLIDGDTVATADAVWQNTDRLVLPKERKKEAEAGKEAEETKIAFTRFSLASLTLQSGVWRLVFRSTT